MRLFVECAPDGRPYSSAATFSAISFGSMHTRTLYVQISFLGFKIKRKTYAVNVFVQVKGDK